MVPPGIPNVTSTPCLFISSMMISDPVFRTVGPLPVSARMGLRAGRAIQPAAAFLRRLLPPDFPIGSPEKIMSPMPPPAGTIGKTFSSLLT